jgi:hypothetical protein
MTEIHEDFENKFKEKMKKIQQSNELIKQLEEKRINDLEYRRIAKYENKYENTSRYKIDIMDKKSKEKRRIEDVKENFEEIQKNIERKNRELANKLKAKNKTFNRLSEQNLENYLIKRKTRLESFSQNFNNIRKATASKNMRYLVLQSEKNNRSIDKIKSLDLSKDNVR